MNPILCNVCKHEINRHSGIFPGCFPPLDVCECTETPQTIAEHAVQNAFVDGWNAACVRIDEIPDAPSAHKPPEPISDETGIEQPCLETPSDTQTKLSYGDMDLSQGSTTGWFDSLPEVPYE